MPQINVQVGGRERLEAAISKATPLGALPTLAVVRLGQLTLSGSAAALRALADACEEAAAMAEEYDRDPEAWEQHELGHRIAVEEQAEREQRG